MLSMGLVLLNIIVVIVMIVTFIKAFGTFRKVGKIDNYEAEVSDEMKLTNKKGTRYLLISVLLVPVSVFLTLVIVFANIMH